MIYHCFRSAYVHFYNEIRHHGASGDSDTFSMWYPIVFRHIAPHLHFLHENEKSHVAMWSRSDSEISWWLDCYRDRWRWLPNWFHPPTERFQLSQKCCSDNWWFNSNCSVRVEHQVCRRTSPRNHFCDRVGENLILYVRKLEQQKGKMIFFLFTSVK